MRRHVTRNLSSWRLSVRVGAAVGALVLVVAVFILVFGGAILNRYSKKRAERAFADAHPGCALQIGEMEYAVSANRLTAQSLTLSSTNATLKVGRVLLTGVRWTRLLWGKASLADVVAQASLDATNLDLELPQAHYRMRCVRLRASVAASELIAEGTELQPSAGDEAFFAAHAYRTPRFRIVLPECRVLGLAYADVFRESAYRAQSVHFSRPFFEALINRDKPPKPIAERPLMVGEALASILQPLQVGTLSLTNGHFRYCERLAVGADPAVLTLGEVSLSVEGIANRGDASASIQLQGQSELMNAGTMKVRMSIPITSPDFSLHYSGTLSAMDLTRLDPFLEIAEHTRIKSGSAQEAAFEIDVTAGQARGQVRAIYRDLEITLLDRQTGSEKGLAKRVASFLVNVKTRNANTPGESHSKEGVVNYVRRPDDEFQQFVWFALRTGVLDIISQ